MEKEQTGKQDTKGKKEERMTKKKPLAERIWDTLSKINVNKELEKKGGFDYLSWSYAWEKLMEHYPSATHDYTEHTYPDKTMMIRCTITITEGSEEFSRTMFLPVMNNRNQAIANPNARQISDNMQRCMVKTVAMLGLGLYVYAGEDLPKSDKQDKESLDSSNVESPELLEAQAVIKQAYSKHGKDIFDVAAKELVQSQSSKDVIAAADQLKKAGMHKA